MKRRLLDILTSIVILLLLSLDTLIMNKNVESRMAEFIKIFLGLNLFLNFTWMLLAYNYQQRNKWLLTFQLFTSYMTINQLIILLQVQRSNCFLQYYNMLFIYFLFSRMKKHAPTMVQRVIANVFFFVHFLIYQLAWQGASGQYFSFSITIIQLVYLCLMEKDKQKPFNKQGEYKDIIVTPRDQEQQEIIIQEQQQQQQNDLANKQMISSNIPNDVLSQNFSSRDLSKLLMTRNKNQGKSFVDTKLSKISEEKHLYQQLWHFLPFGIILLHQQRKIIYYNSKVEGYLECQGQHQVYNKLNSYLNNHIVFDSQKNLGQSRPNKFMVNNKRQTCMQLEFQEKVQNIYRKTSKTYVQDKRNVDKVDEEDNSILNLIFDEYQKYENSQGHLLQDSQLSSSKTIAEFKIEFDSQKQQKRLLKLTICPIRQESDESNQKTSLVIILSNITTKLNLTRLQKNFKFELSLISSFSHELRTPLNLSFQLLESCKSLVSQDIYENYLEPIRISNQLLLIQINDILDFSLIQQNQFSLCYQNFFIEALVQEINQIYKQSFLMKDQSFDVVVDEDIKKSYIKNDLNRVKQILINLINNSQKFTESKGSITLAVSNQSKQNFIFTVEDTGIGINTVQLEAIKNYLNKGILSNSEQKYIGLGLKISDKIARYLNASSQGLSIKSEEGKGTSIRFLVTNLLVKEKSFKIVNKKPEEAKIQNRVYVKPLQSDFSFQQIAQDPTGVASQALDRKFGRDKSHSIEFHNQDKIQVLIVDPNFDFSDLLAKLVPTVSYDVFGTASESLLQLRFKKSIYKLVILDVAVSDMDWKQCYNLVTPLSLPTLSRFRSSYSKTTPSPRWPSPSRRSRTSSRSRFSNSESPTYSSSTTWKKV